MSTSSGRGSLSGSPALTDPVQLHLYMHIMMPIACLRTYIVGALYVYVTPIVFVLYGCESTACRCLYVERVVEKPEKEAAWLQTIG